MVTHTIPGSVIDYVGLKWDEDFIQFTFVKHQRSSEPQFSLDPYGYELCALALRPDGTRKLLSVLHSAHHLHMVDTKGETFVLACSSKTHMPSHLKAVEDLYKTLDRKSFLVSGKNKPTMKLTVDKPIRAVTISPDERMVAVLTRGKLFIFDLDA